ncbi:hypothetical protein ACLB2K_005469 [Fragaria x ananassa]
MGRPIVDYFGAYDGLQGIKDLISAFIVDGSWVLTDLLQLHFPALCNKIEHVPLATNASMEDTLIWMSLSTGDLIAKHAYQFLQHPSPSMPWIIKSFSAECRLRRAPRVIEVVWHPPVIGWVKINSDGVWKHAEGVGGFGAVFRDFKGHVLGAFSSNIDIPSSVAAEVMTIIVAIEFAWVRDWKYIWLEVDSSLVLDYLRSPLFVH